MCESKLDRIIIVVCYFQLKDRAVKSWQAVLLSWPLVEEVWQWIKKLEYRFNAPFAIKYNTKIKLKEDSFSDVHALIYKKCNPSINAQRFQAGHIHIYGLFPELLLFQSSILKRYDRFSNLPFFLEVLWFALLMIFRKGV